MTFTELVDDDIQNRYYNYHQSHDITTESSRLSSTGRFAVLKKVKLIINRGWCSCGENWMVEEEQDEENSINPQLSKKHVFYVVLIDSENIKGSDI